MTVRLRQYLCLLFLPFTLATATPSHANPTVIPESASLAKTVEIADVHMHLVGQSVEFHKKQMDRNNVRLTAAGISNHADPFCLSESQDR